MTAHTGRVGSLAWNGAVHSLLSSGSADALVSNHDLRQHCVISVYKAHNQEVCGLKWSNDGSNLASGGNDNLLHIWDIQRTIPRCTLTKHSAAVKALAWSPFQRNLLVSGGGTKDCNLCSWNTSTGCLLSSTNTESQITGILWSKQRRELISTHGFIEKSARNLVVWDYPSMTRIAELHAPVKSSDGSELRVLHCCLSPDGTTVAVAGGEVLQFWRVWSEI